PILLASTEVTKGLFDRAPHVQWKGIGFLAIFDMVFLTALWLFGEYLLEEYLHGEKCPRCRGGVSTSRGSRLFIVFHSPHGRKTGSYLPHLVSACCKRVDGPHGVLYFLYRERAVRSSPPAAMGLARGSVRRSRSGIYHRRACNWPHLGASRMGNLVDVGCAAHFDFCAMASLCLLLALTDAHRRA